MEAHAIMDMAKAKLPNVGILLAKVVSQELEIFCVMKTMIKRKEC